MFRSFLNLFSVNNEVLAKPTDARQQQSVSTQSAHRLESYRREHEKESIEVISSESTTIGILNNSNEVNHQQMA